MAATASDLIKSGMKYKTVVVNGMNVEVRGLTVAEALKFSELSKGTENKIILFAHLVKMCCPAFRWFWWWPGRIVKRLPSSVLFKITEEIMAESGYDLGAVDKAVKS